MQIYPDTISVCHDFSTGELSVAFAKSLRKQEKVVHYTAWDSSWQIREATHTVEREEESWLVHPAIGFGGTLLGAIIGFLAGSLK